MNFNEHLKRQLGYLERSSESYDKGCKDEAVRIATVIRVLIHDTKSSVSVLKHLNSKTINLLSTVSSLPPNTFYFLGMGMTRVSGGVAYFEPTLGDGPPINSFMSVSKWWDQEVFILEGHNISRRNIVLTAANKDGGAHVDKKLTKDYEALAKSGVGGKLIYQFDEIRNEQPLDDAHFVALRQMAYELLNSLELTNLAEGN